MSKRFYYETEETRTTKTKGYVEIDMDFTQVYHCFSQIAPKINSSTSFKLMFWLLANEATKSNGFHSSKALYEEFNTYLNSKCTNCSISYRTFINCMNELLDAQALSKIGRSQYFFNPHIFWNLEKQDRVNLLTDGERNNYNTFFNPLKLIDK